MATQPKFILNAALNRNDQIFKQLKKIAVETKYKYTKIYIRI